MYRPSDKASIYYIGEVCENADGTYYTGTKARFTKSSHSFVPNAHLV